MNKILTSALCIAVMTCITSCDEKARLADSVTGSWSGQAERIDTPNQPTTTTVTRMLTFTPDLNSSTGGTLRATAMFSVESGTKLQPTGIQPIAVTVNGSATISGHWEAIDDDEIAVSFDSRTLTIDIDPQEVLLEYDITTQEATPMDESIKPDIAASVKRSMTNVMNHSVFNYGKIDDIKVKGLLMSCEINKKDYTLHRDM
ncbi:MAG: hypothetical protein K2L41_01760 [Muribaculaceae bacterium]|nr:hypothetical protein [Muribaculaceae bacterium]